jgi:hypothetical protein
MPTEEEIQLAAEVALDVGGHPSACGRPDSAGRSLPAAGAGPRRNGCAARAAAVVAGPSGVQVRCFFRSVPPDAMRGHESAWCACARVRSQRELANFKEEAHAERARLISKCQEAKVTRTPQSHHSGLPIDLTMLC